MEEGKKIASHPTDAIKLCYNLRRCVEIEPLIFTSQKLDNLITCVAHTFNLDGTNGLFVYKLKHPSTFHFNIFLWSHPHSTRPQFSPVMDISNRNLKGNFDLKNYVPEISR